VHELNPIGSRARSQGVNFLAFKWTSVDNNNMTSIVVGIPDAPTVVFEITSPNEPHILDVSTLPTVKPRFGSAIDQVMNRIESNRIESNRVDGQTTLRLGDRPGDERRESGAESRNPNPNPTARCAARSHDMTCHDMTVCPQVRRSVP